MRTRTRTHAPTHTPGWMSQGMTAQKRKRKRKIEKDLTFLFNLRFTWDSAVTPDLWPLSMSKYSREQRCEASRERWWLLVPSLSSSQMWGEVTGVSKHKANCRTFTQTQKQNQLRYTLHNYKHLKKWTVVETFIDLTWRSFFLFLYIDINYITTTREIRNSSFCLYMMNVSNCIKVTKVTQRTGVYINALPT